MYAVFTDSSSLLNYLEKIIKGVFDKKYRYFKQYVNF